MVGRRLFGVPQEARINAGVTQGQRLAIDADRAVLQRPNQLLGCVHQREQIAAMLPAIDVGRRDEHFERRIARACAHPGEARVHAYRTVLDRDDRIGDTERQVVMRMHAALRFRLQYPVIGLQPRGIAVHRQRAAAVGHVHAMCAIIFHQTRLFSQWLRLAHVAHHQESRDVHAERASALDMLLRDVGLGTVRCHPDRADPQIVGALEVVDRTDTRDQQGRKDAVLQHLGDRTDPVPIGVTTETVIER